MISRRLGTKCLLISSVFLSLILIFSEVALASHAETGEASNIKADSATLRGTGGNLPEDGSFTGWFRFGQSSVACDNLPEETGQTRISNPSGAMVPYQMPVTGLSENTRYYYCAVVESFSLGRHYGSVRSFTTPRLPSVSTDSATNITGTSAELGGDVNPNGLSTTAWHRYSSTNPGSCNDTFGTRVPSSGGISMGSGTSSVHYESYISGLTPGTQYYFCAIGESSAGKDYGSVYLFVTTATPTVTTRDATSITISSATLNGRANPNGDSTHVRFRYHSRSSPGTCADTNTFGTAVPSGSARSIGSGSSNVDFSENISGLAAGTTYHYCAIGFNSAGHSFGSVVSFSTLSETPADPCSARSITFSLSPDSHGYTGSPPSSIRLTGSASTAPECAGKVVTIRDSNCGGNSFASWSIGSDGSTGTREFNGAGVTKTYKACIDKTGDADYNDTNEQSNGEEVVVYNSGSGGGGSCHNARGSGTDGHCNWAPSTNPYHKEGTGQCYVNSDCTCPSGQSISGDPGHCVSNSVNMDVEAGVIIEDGIPGKPNEGGTGSVVYFAAEADTTSNYCCIEDIYFYISGALGTREIVRYDPYDCDDVYRDRDCDDDTGEIWVYNYFTRVEIPPHQDHEDLREQDDSAEFNTSLNNPSNGEYPRGFNFPQSGTYGYYAEADHSENSDLDTTSASKSFIIHPSPDVVFDQAPTNPTTETTANFAWHCTQEPCEYKYRLDDRTWTDWVTNTSVTFSGVSPGNHVFSIHARNSTIKAKGVANNHQWEITLPVGENKMFVTSSRYEGWLLPDVTNDTLHLESSRNLPVYEADIICQQHANNARLNWSYKALISKANSDDDEATNDQIFEARDRLSSCGAYYNMAGELVANNCTDLWDGSIANAIKFNENGSPISYYAWTGTYSNGTGNTSDEYSNEERADDRSSCVNWTSNKSWDTDGSEDERDGIAGNPNSTVGSWVDSGAYQCGTRMTRRSYDEEQKKGLYCYRDPLDAVQTRIESGPSNGQSELTANFTVSCRPVFSSERRPCRFEYRVMRKADIDANPSNWSNYNLETVSMQSTAGETTMIELTGYRRGGTFYPFSREAYRLEIRAITDEPQEELIWKTYDWEFGLPAGAQYIFATRNSSNGNLGGISGADSMCQTAGQTLVPGGRFRALLSTDTVNAKDRISGCNFWNAKKEQVSASCSDFWDGNLLRPIRYDQTGADAAASVWTGTNPDGTLQGNPVTLTVTYPSRTTLQIYADDVMLRQCNNTRECSTPQEFSVGSHNYYGRAVFSSDSSERSNTKSFVVAPEGAPAVDVYHSPENPGRTTNITFTVRAHGSPAPVQTKIYYSSGTSAGTISRTCDASTCSASRSYENNGNRSYYGEAIYSDGTVLRSATNSVRNNSSITRPTVSHSPSSPIPAGQTCENWTSNLSTESSSIGGPGYSNSRWTDNGSMACHREAPIYCVQEPPVPPLDTYIDGGPMGTTTSTTAKFDYSCNHASCTFQYRLKRPSGTWDAWSGFSSSGSKTYTGLSQGNYEFEVAARSGDVTDSSPASRSWTIGPPGIIETRPR